FTANYLPFLLETGFLFFLAGSLWFIYKRFRKINSANLQHETWFRNLANRSFVAWLLGFGLTAFYVVLYWFPEKLSALITFSDPLSRFLRNQPADHWFLYGAFYTLAVLIMGFRALLKYRHSNYHTLRTWVNMLVQLLLAFLLPGLLLLFNQPEFYFSYFWPLKFDYLFPEALESLLSQPGGLPVFMICWSFLLTFVATPMLTFFLGKHWYCSLVCGCVALAEAAGGPFP